MNFIQGFYSTGPGVESRSGIPSVNHNNNLSAMNRKDFDEYCSLFNSSSEKKDVFDKFYDPDAMSGRHGLPGPPKEGYNLPCRQCGFLQIEERVRIRTSNPRHRKMPGLFVTIFFLFLLNNLTLAEATNPNSHNGATTLSELIKHN